MEAKICKQTIPLTGILKSLSRREDPSTGTVVIHAGRVKLPGKIKAALTHAVLEPVVEDPAAGLRRICELAGDRYPVNNIEVHHRLGKALPGEYLLVVLVSAATRAPAFDACRWVVDEIKKEGIIRLVEKEG
jgi:molybdopterin synthase catalytic subunit